MDELLPFVASLEEVPEVLRSTYAEKDGRFVLKVKSVDGFELAGPGLKKALEAERARASELANKLKGFEGVDVERYKTLAKKVEEIDSWTPDQKMQEMMRARLAEQSTRFEEEKKKVAAANDKLRAVIDKETRTAAAVRAIAEAKGSAKLLLPIVLAHTRLVERDNGFGVEVIDPTTGVARIGDSEGNAMTVNQFVADLRKDPDYARAFEAEGGQGSGAGGAKPKAGERGGPGVVSRDDLRAKSLSITDIAAGKVVVK